MQHKPVFFKYSISVSKNKRTQRPQCYKIVRSNLLNKEIMATLTQIEHFVVLMLENRSFDNLLGKLYPANGDFEGLTGNEFNPGNSTKIQVWSDLKNSSVM